jgi:hypothetical protein
VLHEAAVLRVGLLFVTLILSVPKEAYNIQRVIWKWLGAFELLVVYLAWHIYLFSNPEYSSITPLRSELIQ